MVVYSTSSEHVSTRIFYLLVYVLFCQSEIKVDDCSYTGCPTDHAAMVNQAPMSFACGKTFTSEFSNIAMPIAAVQECLTKRVTHSHSFPCHHNKINCLLYM